MTQKIRKYKGQHVDVMDYETEPDNQTLFLFPPNDEAKFIDGVRRARKGFQRKREIVDIDDKHVEFVYSEQGHRAFKKLFNFGAIIEELEYNKKDKKFSHTNIDSHKKTQRRLMYQRTYSSMMILKNISSISGLKQQKLFKLQKSVVGTSMQELIQKHWQGHRQILYKNDGEYNLCYMEAIAKALHPDIDEKRYMPCSIISIAREYLVEVLDIPFKAKSREMTKYLKTFEGLDFQKYSQIITQK
ncbi:MAG: hypothetical protein EZS28_024675, partial [Streblomastix strix]